MCNPRKLSCVLSRAAVVTASLSAVILRPAAAQATTFHACYVPTVGAMYLIKLSGLPLGCLSTAHVEISWTDSGGVANGSVTTAKLADGAVTAIKLAADAVGSAQVLDGSLTGADLVAGAVGTSQIANGAVNTINLAAGAVTNSTIAAQAVNSTKILDGSLTGADLMAGAVGSTQLANGSVTRVKLGNDAFAAIAWGFVALDGTLDGHSANVTSATFNASIGAYLVTISNESYNTSYATIVTANSPTLITRALPVTVNSVPFLGVFLYNLAGTAVQGNFQFVTFK